MFKKGNWSKSNDKAKSSKGGGGFGNNQSKKNDF